MTHRHRVAASPTGHPCSSWQESGDGALRRGSYVIRIGASGKAIAAFNDQPIGGVHDTLLQARSFCEGHAAALANGEDRL